MNGLEREEARDSSPIIGKSLKRGRRRRLREVEVPLAENSHLLVG